MPYRASLNLKSDEAHELARQLSERTGESMTTAVIEALRERLNRLNEARDSHGLKERILAIGKECATEWREPYRYIDHGEFLYDERGLPR